MALMLLVADRGEKWRKMAKNGGKKEVEGQVEGQTGGTKLVPEHRGREGEKVQNRA